jgi:hypothetical protein
MEMYVLSEKDFIFLAFDIKSALFSMVTTGSALTSCDEKAASNKHDMKVKKILSTRKGTK